MTAGAAVPEVIGQTLAFDIGIVNALAKTPDEALGAIPAYICLDAKVAVGEILVTASCTGKGKLPATCFRPHILR